MSSFQIHTTSPPVIAPRKNPFRMSVPHRSPQPTTTQAILRGVTRSHVTVTGGVRIHYRRLGSGPPIVLLHGFPQTGHCWRKVMPALAARFTVVAPDLRGYGDSDRPPSGYDKRRMAADVAELIQTLALAPVVLVGHDRGGRVAHRFALDHPQLLTRLVLLDIAPTYHVFARMDPHTPRAP